MKAKNTTTFSKSILCLLITIIFGTLAIAQKLDLEKRAKISEFQSALDTYHISHDSGKVYVTQRVTRLFLHGLESEIRLFTENHVSKLEATLKDFQDRPIGSCLQFLDSAVNIYNHQLALRQAFLDFP